MPAKKAPKVPRKKAVHPKRNRKPFPSLELCRRGDQCDKRSFPPAILITGRRIAMFTFSDLPSWNDMLYETQYNRHAGAGAIRRLKRLGYDSAMTFAELNNLLIEDAIEYPKRKKKTDPQPDPIYFARIRDPVVERAAIVVRVWRPNANKYDVINASIKAICDGFTRAHLWRDDDSSHVPRCLLDFGGVDEKAPRVELMIYELPDVDRHPLLTAGSK